MELVNGLLRKTPIWHRGQTLTEYSLIVFFVGVAAYSAYSELGIGIKTFASNLATFISSAVAAL